MEKLGKNDKIYKNDEKISENICEKNYEYSSKNYRNKFMNNLWKN